MEVEEAGGHVVGAIEVGGRGAGEVEEAGGHVMVAIEVGGVEEGVFGMLVGSGAGEGEAAEE